MELEETEVGWLFNANDPTNRKLFMPRLKTLKAKALEYCEFEWDAISCLATDSNGTEFGGFAGLRE